MAVSKFAANRVSAAKDVLFNSVTDHDDHDLIVRRNAALEIHLDSMIQLVESLTGPDQGVVGRADYLLKNGWTIRSHPAEGWFTGNQRFEVVLTGPMGSESRAEGDGFVSAFLSAFELTGTEF